jgi:hypothetical protein
MDNLVEELMAWVLDGGGTPSSVPTRYSGEIALPGRLDAASFRIAIRKAFADGIWFNAALADAADAS